MFTNHEQALIRYQASFMRRAVYHFSDHLVPLLRSLARDVEPVIPRLPDTLAAREIEVYSSFIQKERLVSGRFIFREDVLYSFMFRFLVFLAGNRIVLEAVASMETDRVARILRTQLVDTVSTWKESPTDEDTAYGDLCGKVSGFVGKLKLSVC